MDGDSTEHDDEALGIVKDLAGAVSTQAHVANHLWLALMTAAAVALLPRPTASSGTGLVLPFGLGDIAPDAFYPALLAVLVVLTIAFAAAHAQQIRAQRLAQDAIDSLLRTSGRVAGIHLRDLFDMLRQPSVNRVAALSQLLRGPYQFYSSTKACPTWLRVLSTVYYIVLKAVSLAVYFGLPAVALFHAYTRSASAGREGVAIVVGATVAAAALAHVAIVDVLYLVKVAAKIWGPGSVRP